MKVLLNITGRTVWIDGYYHHYSNISQKQALFSTKIRPICLVKFTEVIKPQTINIRNRTAAGFMNGLCLVVVKPGE